MGPGQSLASLEKDLNGLKEEGYRQNSAQRLISSSPHFQYCYMNDCVQASSCKVILF